jgi:hypothetical protein
MSITAVFGWSPTCAYADMPRLKSNDAMRRREFVPRDPCRANQPWRCVPRWQALGLGTTRVGFEGQERCEMSGVQRREAAGRTQRQCSISGEE